MTTTPAGPARRAVSGLTALRLLVDGPVAHRDLLRHCDARTVERLARARYLVRMVDPADRRRTLAALTDRGRAALAEGEPAPEAP